MVLLRLVAIGTTGCNLTVGERRERDDWSVTVYALHGHYVMNVAMRVNAAVTSVGMLLHQRLAPPRLSDVDSSRAAIPSNVRSRLFPRSLHVWTGF
jgi:hypothetical protein